MGGGPERLQSLEYTGHVTILALPSFFSFHPMYLRRKTKFNKNQKKVYSKIVVNVLLVVLPQRCSKRYPSLASQEF